MAAPNQNNHPPGLVEYLVHGNKSADKRLHAQESSRDVTAWITPTLINSFAAPPAPMTPVAYRFHMKTSSLEFRGHIDASSTQSNGIAFHIVEPFWPSHDLSYITDVQTAISGTFNSCRVRISSVDGAVTLTWPAT